MFWQLSGVIIWFVTTIWR